MPALLPVLLPVLLPAVLRAAPAPETVPPDFVPVYHPELTVGRKGGDICVDGRLDDVGWHAAARAAGFAEHSPGDQTRPPVDTEILATYDDSHLYVAWICRDDPATVRASFCERDRIFNDDYVILCLDTFGDAVNAYELAVNPYGIQGDLYFAAAGGEDIRYDFIFETAAAITDQGWVAEMAVPFASLRFPSRDEQVWRMDFWRNRPRQSREQFSWAAYDRDDPCWLCQWGTMRGIRGVQGGRGLELLPAVVAHQSGGRDEGDAWRDGDVLGDLSLGAKYAFSSDLSAEITFNPDYSQVESDAAQIDVNTNFALYYDERRPFFQEGADLFTTWFNAIYTRSINRPTMAAKLTGRNGRGSFALLSAYDENTPIILPFAQSSEVVSNGESFANLLRYKRELADQTHLGLIATDRRYQDGGYGSLAGLDSRVRLGRTLSLESQFLVSFTGEPADSLLGAGFAARTFDGGRRTAAFDGERFRGHALYASLEREGRAWSLDLDWWDYSPTFRAENGYEVRNDSRLVSLNNSYLWRLEGGGLVEWIQPAVYVSRRWDYADRRQGESGQVDLSWRLRRAQANFHTQYLRGAELHEGVQFDGLWRWHQCAHLSPSDKVSFGGNFNYGHRVYYGGLVPGRQLDCGGWVDLKPIDRLLIETSLSYSQSRHLRADDLYYAGYVTRAKLTLQMTRELSARLVVQYNSFRRVWEVDPLVSCRLNPFSIFYCGSTRDYDLATGEHDREYWRLSDRQYFLKLQYLFQL